MMLTEKEAQEALSAKIREKVAAMDDATVARELARLERREAMDKLGMEGQVGGAFMKVGNSQTWDIFVKKVAAAGGIEKMSDEQKQQALAETEAEVDALGDDIVEREGAVIEARESEASEGSLPEKEAMDLAAMRACDRLFPGELAKHAAEKLKQEGYELVEKGQAKK